MKIQAAVLFEPHRPFEIIDLDLAEPGAGEVRVRIAAAGVCHSDYHLVSGATQHPMPVVAGHEGAGVVEAVGAGVTAIKAGDHVTLNWTPDCGHCFYCDRDLPILCETYLAHGPNAVAFDGESRVNLLQENNDRGGDLRPLATPQLVQFGAQTRCTSGRDVFGTGFSRNAEPSHVFNSEQQRTATARGGD